MALSRDKGYDRVIFASDCLSLINRIKSPSPDRSPVGSVVVDIRSLVTSFATVSFRHASRSINEAAHILARSCVDASLGFTLDYALDCIRQTLCIDIR